MVETAEVMAAAASVTGTARVIDSLARRGGQLRGGECVLRGTGEERVLGSAVGGSPGRAARTGLAVHLRSCSAGSEEAAVQSWRRVAVPASAVRTVASVQTARGSSRTLGGRGCGTARMGSREGRPSRGTGGSSSAGRRQGVVEGAAAVSGPARGDTATGPGSSESAVGFRRRLRAAVVLEVAAAVLRALVAPTSSALLPWRLEHSAVAHGTAPPSLHHSTSPSRTRLAASA